MITEEAMPAINDAIKSQGSDMKTEFSLFSYWIISLRIDQTLSYIIRKGKTIRGLYQTQHQATWEQQHQYPVTPTHFRQASMNFI